MHELTWDDVRAWRLARHSLLERKPAEKLVDVVREVCGIQAQVMVAAELAVGIRLQDVTRQAVRSALWEQRTLVKTYGIRGTIHLFAADELPLWMAALRARAAADPKRQEQMGLEVTQVEAILQAIYDALDGQCLTMKQLGEEVGRRVGAWTQETNSLAWSGKMPVWRMAMGDAALAGVLCYGPPQGSEVTFVRPDQWLGSSEEMDPDEALTEVFRRYLRTYGPATARDFAQWFALPPRAAREVAEAVSDELTEVDIEGKQAFLLKEDAETFAASKAESVRLLPHFDSFVIGCHPRNQLLPADWGERVPARTTASQLPTLLVNGKVAGIWERKAKGRKLEICVDAFDSLRAREKELLEAEVERVGEILEAEPSFSLDSVAARPHL